MRIYESVDKTISEWSRQLSVKYGNQYARYSSNKETLEVWSNNLTNQ